ncbi:regucalcin-like isoform X2 [Leptinotarsa decemlineata]|uniref:regucalcin-like isoform X2 n=1 Tax=Leptinotarsa decemlineata TaxID=7539 RepID=UPI003D304906
MSSKIEVILEGFSLLEGPHWDIEKQCLYFVDIHNHSIFKYVPSTKKLTKAVIGNHNVSIIIPIKDKKDNFVITVDRSVSTITWDGESNTVLNLKKLYEVDHGTDHVFNDGKCDSSGRLWSGTMGAHASTIDGIPPGKGTLYSFQNNLVQNYRGGIGISNGIAFNKELGKMYYIDSMNGTVDQYDLDINRGTLSNLQPIFTREKHGFDECLFDGMTIDSDGNLWVAIFLGSKVIKIDPRRPETLLETIEFPASQITSVAFGGANLDELWVTSANFKEFSPGQKGGSLFKVTGINARGLPADEAVCEIHS